MRLSDDFCLLFVVAPCMGAWIEIEKEMGEPPGRDSKIFNVEDFAISPWWERG
ncbi:hypothetical protein [Desulfitobacterium dehalogenans]|uniref:hypothetical protein n=1 Tax=Desulfitobacterium dehalogenans TaxID=36854 RepID=UPI0002E04A64|nr:hypothetical protein [Desulfitobacterium dehalogenans]